MSSARKKRLTSRFGIAFVLLMSGIGLTLFDLSRVPDLTTQIDTARDALKRARTTHTLDFDAELIAASPFEVETPEARKIVFLAKMLPLVIAENQRILAQRKQASRTPSAAQLNAFALVYGLDPGHVRKETLLKRIDVLPPSLVLAQAAVESAWGTSRFAREGNAFFGERTYDPDTPGISPKRASGFKVKSFRTPQDSVRSYMRTLNSHPAYRALRERRAAVRAQGQALTGKDLARRLSSYSELGSTYVDMIIDTIEANRLGEFNALIATSK